MENRIEVLKTERGREKLNWRGYLYVFDKKGAKNSQLWECQERRNGDKCPARLHTTRENDLIKFLRSKGTHSHEPTSRAVEINRFITNVKKDAVLTKHAPAQIIAINLQDVSPSTQGSLPRMETLKRTIQRSRGESGRRFLLPHNREDIDLPTPYRQLVNGTDFILYDSGPVLDRIMLFGTRENLQYLAQCNMWMCDGTFKVSPPMFDQLFVIHGLRQNRAFPLVYCLTPNRTASTYMKVLDKLKELQPTLNPPAIMTDFEKASLNAFARTFPGAEQKACYFHFRQAILRKLRQFPELYEKYRNENDFSLQIKHVIALAFIPPEDVIPAFEMLLEEPFFEENETLMSEFIEYVERTWIGPMNRRGTVRLAPIYPVDRWNCYHSVLEGTPKTNNHCEGFNRRFAVLLGVAHPTIYKFIDGLKQQQAFTDTIKQQFLSGALQPQAKPLSIEVLQDVVSEYATAQFSVIEQLQRLAYRIII